MGMEFNGEKYVLVCASCGEKDPLAWQQKGDVESCSACGHVVDTTPRDYAGGKVRIPTDYLGKPNFATGKVFNSSREYSNYLKEKKYVITG